MFIFCLALLRTYLRYIPLAWNISKYFGIICKANCLTIEGNFTNQTFLGFLASNTNGTKNCFLGHLGFFYSEVSNPENLLIGALYLPENPMNSALFHCSLSVCNDFSSGLAHFSFNFLHEVMIQQTIKSDWVLLWGKIFLPKM